MQKFRSQDQANFNAIIKAHMADPDAPLLLEGATGLGKTRAYLSAVIQAAESGKRIAIALPSHQLIDQLLASSDLAATTVSGLSVKAFKPAGFFENRKAYTEHKDSVLQAKVMLCTCASVIIDHRLKGGYNGVMDRDYIVFDEADQLPASAALQSDCVITSAQFKEMGIKVETAEQAVRAALAKKEVEPEVKAQALMILEAVQEPTWFYKTGVTDDGGVMLFHQLPGRLLKQVANQNNVAFISATLSIAGSFDDFKRAMGIQTVSKLSNTIEPIKHGKLYFHVSDLEVDTPEWMGIVQKTVDEARSKAIESFVPKRFSSQWADKGVLEASRVEVTLSKLERDLTVRKKALSYYGQYCLACGFKPKHISQIEVHHLLPLSEGGERLTNIQDVAVLCASCHRLAHSTKPPMSVEAMKIVNDYF
ncbi:MAG: DEAD/DEAH box helicase [Burkholderiales bacterium]|nr:DEAD/DEAH box helicase [Burkholderiales bacterium]